MIKIVTTKKTKSYKKKEKIFYIRARLDSDFL